MQEGEREEAGRGSASRASRGVQGLPPEETKSLDEVKREARKANAANHAHQALFDDEQDEGLPGDVTSAIAGEEELNTPALGMPEDEVKILENPARRQEDEEVEVLLEGDVELLDKASLVKTEQSLVTVQEVKELPGADPLVPVLETPGPRLVETPRQDLGVNVAEIQARDYVAEPVRRWECAPSGRISPPSVE
ncbi:hypothetical protein PR003_g17347 [Phytophthora rubi]|uniref:Uncharacterized protein n=1 Tax=Phytophthora rubi TaxID=129364 RepID=A0A6A3KK27_9STRA|nr:hypothetical protein PR001_g16889 [Phytophthora rubi]KAE9321961.1 hypothetical protein PR003_g17347 [Phytophthora rubi]